MKHIFILNPTAASGETASLYDIIKNYCINNNVDYSIIKTEYEKHAGKIASTYTKNDNVRLYSIGGDGTANEVLNGINDDVALSIIPAGSGNDFYRMIYDEKEFIKSLDETVNGKIVYVDYATINNFKFLNSTTLGLDARVNHMIQDIHKKTHISKKLLYGFVSILAVLNPKPISLKLKYDNEVIEKKATLIAIMNGKYYGNGIKPIDDPTIQDGYLDIILIDDLKLIKLASLLPKYLKGNTSKIKEIKTYKAKEIEILTDESAFIQSDGENFKSNNISIKVNHKKLKLIVPKKSKLEI